MTKHPINSVDLCAGEVRVSAKGLKRLAEIAVYGTQAKCERAMRDASAMDSGPMISNYMAADRLVWAAQDLAHALRFLHAFDSLAKGERELTVHPDRADNENL